MKETQSIKRIAVIGAGISGIASAHTMQKRGHEVVIYEKTDKVGGVWAHSYPDVSLQNTWQQYHISDFPYPITPHLHPTAKQITDYMQSAIEALNIDVRLNHSVTSMEDVEGGWQLTLQHDDETQTETFDYVIIAVGQYTGRKQHLNLMGQSAFNGTIMTEVDIQSLDVFKDKRVVVVGFGKSALDMVTFAVKQGASEVHQVFRTPRWTIPEYIAGLHYTTPFFGRFGSVMMTSWAQPNKMERFLHERLGFVVDGFWKIIAKVMSFQRNRAGANKGDDARARLKLVSPTHHLLTDLRSAVALAPEDYYSFVADGKIQPHQTEVAGFTSDAIQLSDGSEIPCDMVIASIGSGKPTFPFLPDTYRQLLESEHDGTQLYRHLIHPRIPNLGFAGFNHGFMHIPCVEVGTLWLSALLNDELTLPSVEDMEQTIDYVRQWKRDHIQFEPSRSSAINTRYQQYLDIILQDLGLSPNRKSNPVSEIFTRYSAADYAGLVEEYEQKLGHQGATTGEPLRPIAVHT